ncbi:hypothetical protein SRABI26_02707 [Arthrobacter sp. Bi26]|uniref:hypothetical protein n=1 Tax=Arthrobacter sp. Bi26 TaxID=2822350 RepID=UPI001DA08B86|nr:hypothetical protein [Arthrobacter sp. Bi26]CAH0233449.1 hypothetical protein SRABI26_02707 [Arthrobacter sp. Bi26]
MSQPEPCHRCGVKISKDLPRPGLSRLFGKIYRETWRIKFNYLRMNSWDKAVTAHDVVASNLWTETSLCSDCWGDVLSFINKKFERKP